MLTALERSGLLERDGTGSYVAGRLFWLYAIRHDRWQELVRLARPTMATIGEETSETVHLSIRRGTRVVQVAQVDARFMLGSRDWTVVDVPRPLLGRSARSSTPGASLAIAVPARAPYRGHADRAATSSVATYAAVCVAAGRTTVDELEVGLSGIAVPVHSGARAGRRRSGISGPTQRLHGRHDELGRGPAAARPGSVASPARSQPNGRRGMNTSTNPTRPAEVMA